jgi:biopolymer transport protein ExbD
MARRRKKKGNTDSASPDLTPMIDVTFQLLIFFILCTRFKVEERNHQVQLPKDEGLQSQPSVPKEQITIYCVWDPASLSNKYQVAIGARGRKPVEGSLATLQQIVILPSDNNGNILEKKRLYGMIFDNLVAASETYIEKCGIDRIEKLEISFSVDATKGAASGTAPWMFVSMAIDAAARVNQNRKANGHEELAVTFKFADSLGTYAQ